MLEQTFKITNLTGVDAKMSSLLVKKCSEFQSHITINYEDKFINLKSILGIMSLSIKKNSVVKISCSGVDEVEALKQLSFLISDLKLGKEY